MDSNDKRTGIDRYIRKPTQEEIPWWFLGGLIAVAVFSLLIYGGVVRSGAVFAVSLLLGIAAFAAGGLIGFVFGVPRSRSGSAANGSEDGKPADSNGDDAYRPSTNLDQISDWLTKMLIGVGLIEFGELSGMLGDVGTNIASSFEVQLQEGVSNVVIPAVSIVAQATIVAFGIIGFLAGYLWTRINYGRIQSVMDNEIRRMLQENSDMAQAAMTVATVRVRESSLRSQNEPQEEFTALSAQSNPAFANVDPLVVEKINQFIRAPMDFDSDPTHEIFGDHPSKSNGLQLEVEIAAKTASRGVVLKARVAPEGTRSLTGNVIFLLHPTFTEPVRVATVSQDEAEIEFYSEGWFHIMAIADNGQTVLSYDLRNTQGIPDWFKKQ